MSNWLLLPPLAFALVLLVVWLQYKSLAVLRAGEEWADRPGKGKAYACGEDIKDHRVQPNYSEFFPFAFFFTIMHVMALMVATVPGGVPDAAYCAAAYLICSAIGLFILFRR